MKRFFSTIFFSLYILIGLNSCSNDDDYAVFSTLYGVVTDDATAEPITGATVTLSPGGKTQTTGYDGRYQFSEVDPIQYTVTVQKVGYSANRKMISVISGEPTEANISLRKIN